MAKKTKLRPGQKLGLPRNERELHDRLRALECGVDPVKNGHLLVTLPAPAGGTMQIAKTPSDPANIGNMVTRLRRRGVDVRSMTVFSVSS